MRDRYRCVLLAIDGHEAVDIAEKVGCSRRSAQDWCYRYRDRGLVGLPPTKQPGHPTRLPREREAELLARIDAGPTPQDGVCEFRGRDIQRILEDEFGVKYALNGVYCLLQRLNYTSLQPRPRHEQGDPQQQALFKERAPLLPASSVMRSRRTAVG